MTLSPFELGAHQLRFVITLAGALERLESSVLDQIVARLLPPGLGPADHVRAKALARRYASGFEPLEETIAVLREHLGLHDRAALLDLIRAVVAAERELVDELLAAHTQTLLDAPTSVEAQDLDDAAAEALLARLSCPEGLAPPLPPQPEASGAATPAPWHEWSAFIDAIPGGESLLEEIETLAIRCNDEAQVIALLRRIFVERLAYTPCLIEYTARLGDQSTLQRIVAIARFQDDLQVIVVRLQWPYRYTNLTSSVFGLVQRAVVFVICPGFNFLRLALRPSPGEFRYRTLVGSRIGQEPYENPLQWAWRLSRCAPNPGDDSRRLYQRIVDTFLGSTRALMRSWTSAPRPVDRALPGSDWEALALERYAAFHQLDRDPATSPRRLWGLHRVCFNRSPFALPGIGRLDYDGYEHDPDASLPEAAVCAAAGLSWYRPLVLRLTLTFDGGVDPVQVYIPAAIPRITDDGRMVINGRWLRLVPGVDRDGYVGRALEHTPVATEDLEELLGSSVGDEPEATDDEDTTATEDAPDAEAVELLQGASEETEFEGADLCTLLEHAAYRKLGALAHQVYALGQRLSGRSATHSEVLTELHQLMRRLYGRERRLMLVSKHYLLSVLEPTAEALPDAQRLATLRQRSMVDAHTPPAWACLDLSTALPVGSYYPVSGARLHPGGSLAVPLLEDDRTTWRLGCTDRATTEVNPRVTSDGAGSTETQRQVWCARGLERLAHLPAGYIEAPLAIALWSVDPATTRSTHPSVSLQAVVRPGPVPRAYVSPHLHLERRARQYACYELIDVERPAAVVVEVGQRVEGNTPWLELQPRPGTTVPRRERSGTRRLLHRLFDGQDRNEPLPEARVVPPSCAGIVVRIVDEIVHTPTLGSRLEARLVRIEILACTNHARWVVLDDGRCIPVAGPLAIEDAPYAPDGRAAAIVVELPEAGAASADQDAFVWFAGESGEPTSPATIQIAGLVAAPDEQVVEPSRHARARLIDGEWIPDSPFTSGLTAEEWRVWWLLEPWSAAQASERVRQGFGGNAPFVRALERVLQAACIVPGGPQPAGIDRSLVQIVATRPTKATQRLRKRFAPAAVTVWQCPCGRVSGHHAAFQTCSRCRSRVMMSGALGATSTPALSLPFEIVHPWWRELAGALLGWTSRELIERQTRYAPGLLRLFLERASERPLAAIDARLRERSDERLPELRRARARLEALVRRAGLTTWLDRIWVRDLPVLHPCARPEGPHETIPGLMTHALSARYLRVVNTAERVARFASPRAGILQWISRSEFLHAVDALFGSPDCIEAGAPTTLAALISRVWPWTRPPRLRSTAPSCFAITGAAPAPVSTGDPPASGSDVQMTVTFVDPLAPPRELDLEPDERRSRSRRPTVSQRAPGLRLEHLLGQATREREALCQKRDTLRVRTRRVHKARTPADETSPDIEVLSGMNGAGVCRLSLRLASPEHVSRGFVSFDGITWMPRLHGETAGPADAAFWQTRWAKHLLFTRALPMLASTVAALRISCDGADGANEEDLFAAPDPTSLPAAALASCDVADLPDELLGRHLLAALLSAAASAMAQPYRLVTRLFQGLPVSLPNAFETAREALEPDLAAAFPGDEPRVTLGRHVLLRALLGWYSTPDSGWVWRAPAAMVERRWQRRLVPVSHEAWSTWPDADAFIAPARWFRDVCHDAGAWWKNAVTERNTLLADTLRSPQRQWSSQRANDDRRADASGPPSNSESLARSFPESTHTPKPPSEVDQPPGDELHDGRTLPLTERAPGPHVSRWHEPLTGWFTSVSSALAAGSAHHAEVRRWIEAVASWLDDPRARLDRSSPPSRTASDVARWHGSAASWLQPAPSSAQGDSDPS